MFYYLKGTVAEIGQSSLVLDVSGIGFFINTSLKTLSSVKASSPATLYISESIGESNFDLTQILWLWRLSTMTQKR